MSGVRVAGKVNWFSDVSGYGANVPAIPGV